MNFSSLQLSKVFLVITIGILLMLTYLSYQRVQNLIAYSSLVDNTNLVRIKLEQSLSYSKDAETGQRGFLITGDSIFLEPYINAFPKILETLAVIDSLTMDHPVQQANLERLKKLHQQRFVVMEKMIVQSQRPGITRSNQKALLLRGKMVMDEIFSLSRKMIDIEMKLLRDREQNKNIYVSVTPRFIVLLMFFSLALIITSYFIIIGELKKTIKVQSELEQKVEALNRSNSELEQFAYVASHDLQEPLRKIQSFGDRLVQKYLPAIEEDGKFIIDRMQSAASRMQLLINDLLSYSSWFSRAICFLKNRPADDHEKHQK